MEKKKQKEYIKRTSLNIVNDSLNNLLTENKNTTILDEVTIDGVKRKKSGTSFNKDNSSTYNLVADHTIYPQNRTGEHMELLLEQIPGVGFKGSNNDVYIRRGDKPVIWVIDGVQVAEHPSYLDMANIEKIEVLKSLTTTAVYGPRGVNGVIAITTKTARSGLNPIENFKAKSILKGHNDYKEFYVPKYTTSAKRPYKDYRTTLYWNPMVRTNDKGKVTIYFDTLEEAQNLQIVIEGLSKYGDPGSLTKTFNSNE